MTLTLGAIIRQGLAFPNRKLIHPNHWFSTSGPFFKVGCIFFIDAVAFDFEGRGDESVFWVPWRVDNGEIVHALVVITLLINGLKVRLE